MMTVPFNPDDLFKCYRNVKMGGGGGGLFNLFKPQSSPPALIMADPIEKVKYTCTEYVEILLSVGVKNMWICIWL